MYTAGDVSASSAFHSIWATSLFGYAHRLCMLVLATFYLCVPVPYSIYYYYLKNERNISAVNEIKTIGLDAYTLSAIPFQNLHCRSKWVQKESRKLRVAVDCLLIELITGDSSNPSNQVVRLSHVCSPV